MQKTKKHIVSVEADMAKLEVDRKNFHGSKEMETKCYEEVQPYRKTNYKLIIIIICFFQSVTVIVNYLVIAICFNFSYHCLLSV